MIPAAFAYERAASLEEALALLRDHGEDAKVIAGGQSLLPLMKLRLARPERLIDIGRLDELRGIRPLEDGGLAIGALTTYDALLGDPDVRPYTLLADALPRIGDLQVRNRGTTGGSIAHADPASDMPALLLALDASVVCRSAARGERTMPIDAFIDGPFQTALQPDEILVEIRLPAASGEAGSAYACVEQPASGYAIAGVAVAVGRSGGPGTSIDLVRVAVTGVGDQPYRARRVEAALEGSDLGDAAIAAAVGSVTEGIDVASDIHADRPYRTAMAVVMARRALETARARLG